jgi:dipeptide/tripeptide permease
MAAETRAPVNGTTASLLRIERFNYLIGAILCIGAALKYPSDIALGVGVGVALTCLNFAVLRRLVFRWSEDARKGVSSNRILLVLPKMVALMSAVVVVLWVLPVHAIAFVVGYSIFLVSLTIESIYSALAPSPPADEGDDGDAGPRGPETKTS